MKPHRLSVSWFGLTISLTVCVDFIEGVDLVEGVDRALPSANTAAKSRCFFIFSVWFNPHAAALLRQRLCCGNGCATAKEFIDFCLSPPAWGARDSRALNGKD
jgi:hypothetical protein